jgi:hypothetical protein
MTYINEKFHREKYASMNGYTINILQAITREKFIAQNLQKTVDTIAMRCMSTHRIDA